MRRVHCYCCESSASELWAEENGFKMVRCLNCGLLYVNPMPDEREIDRAAQTGLHQGQEKLDVSGQYGGVAKVENYIRILREIYGDDFFRGKPFKWLDIGCGYGEFMEALIREGGPQCDVRGSEPSEVKSASARQRGLKVSFLDLETVRERFDYVSLLNVYSHLPNPIETLAGVRKLLNAGGELLIETGDAANLERSDYPDKLFLPDHLSFASEEIVCRILEKIGFKIVAVTRLHHPAYRKWTAWDPVIYWMQQRLRGRLGLRRKRVYPYRDLWIRAALRAA
ncbi:MAG: class I SAM-dependent methyltransferase [Verrucomicrobia bacterium]|nr:class I SAM-dependent methyltransferase [Verrucomicrobiota bacterium]